MPLSSTVEEGFVSALRSERRDLIDRLRQTRFSTLKEGYSQAQIVPFASYAPWLDDADFLSLHDLVSSHTLVDIYRCYELYSLARQAGRVAGAIVEIGVWKGGTATIMGAALPDRPMHLFDTFQGVPKADGAFDTLYSGGEHADTTIGEVEALLGRAELTASIHVGIFPDDSGLALPETVAIAHIDVDTYTSARECFEVIWPRVSEGGFIIFDDYGFFGCEGVTQAANEINSSVNDAVFIHNLNGHGVFVKR